MALHFNRVGPATAELETWSASARGFSFVVSHESSSGPGLRGRPGFVASWRPILISRNYLARCSSMASHACSAITANDLAVWQAYPNAAFTLIRTLTLPPAETDGGPVWRGILFRHFRPENRVELFRRREMTAGFVVKIDRAQAIRRRISRPRVQGAGFSSIDSPTRSANSR